MGFIEATPPIKNSATLAAAPVRIGLLKGGRLNVMLRPPVLAALGKAERYQIFIGEPDDEETKNLLKIVPAGGGAFTPKPVHNPFAKNGKKTSAAETVRFTLAGAAHLPDCSVKAVPVSFEHDTDENALLIVLPRWAWDEDAHAEVEADARRKGR